MDAIKAELFAQQLIEQADINGWQPLSLLNFGKSAVVLLASKGDTKVALKVFHPETVKTYGLSSQLIRIGREQSLIGKPHANLVSILDGGVSKNGNHPFIAMQYVPGRRLSDVISDIPLSKIAQFVEQLASAAKHLEDMGIVHRDIKPDNININDTYTSITLLDCGVLRPIGDNSATAQHGERPFIGTHQYAPPEMIHGKEEDSIDGWRAITFYQIGAVLHDLIVQRPLFFDYTNRIADLVEAVDNVIPDIGNVNVDQSLVALARKCLQKKPTDRLRLLQWANFSFSENHGLEDIAYRKRQLIDRQFLQKNYLAHPLDAVETSRLDRNKWERNCSALRAAVELTLDDFSELLPQRTIRGDFNRYPAAAIVCTFQAAKNLGFDQPFHFEYSFTTHDDSAIAQVYLRAGTGEQHSEIGWNFLGEFLDDFSELREPASKWVMQIIEEQLLVKEKGEKQ
jgi:eukaryotic-like serine/threonine-protein kinase